MPNLRQINRVIVDNMAALLAAVIALMVPAICAAVVWGSALGERVTATEIRSAEALQQASESRAANAEMQALLRQVAADVAVLIDRSERE